MVERCALSGSDLKIEFRTILLTSITDEEWYILVIQQVTRDFLPCNLFSTCLYFIVVVFTLKTVLTSIQYPSLSYSSRQRNVFPWSQANPN